MKKFLISIVITAAAFLSGCRPFNTPDLHIIEANETAFVVPLEGANLSTQGQFESVEFLERSKVATKRIVVDRRWRSTGYLWLSGEYVPTARVITVSRTPVSRVWQPVRDPKNGGYMNGIDVESKDSIGFSVGINITAQVLEPETAVFLYWYPGKDLASVIDTNIRADVQIALSEQFAQWDLNTAKAKKNDAFEAVRDMIVPKYKQYGITITSFGLSGGFWFEDEVIQESINAAYAAEMMVARREQEKQAQIFENERLLSIAENQRDQAAAFAQAADSRKAQVQAEVAMMQAEALLEAVKKWDGTLPNFVTIGDSGQSLLMQLPTSLGTSSQ